MFRLLHCKHAILFGWFGYNQLVPTRNPVRRVGGHAEYTPAPTLINGVPMFLLRLIWADVRALFAKRADLVVENLALRQQLASARTSTTFVSLVRRKGAYNGTRMAR